MGLSKAQREAKAAAAQAEADAAAAAAAAEQLAADDAAAAQAQLDADQAAADEAAAAADQAAAAAAAAAGEGATDLDDLEDEDLPTETAKKARAGRRKLPTIEQAAEILSHAPHEVIAVEDSPAGPVATIPDGHKYLLTGPNKGDWVWLTAPAPAEGA